MKKGIALFGLILLISCTQKEVKPTFTLADSKELPGLASPIQLFYDGATVQLQDYFMHPKKLDSFRMPEGINAEWVKDSNLLKLEGNSTKDISNLRCFLDGLFFDIPIKRSTQIKYRFTIPMNKAEEDVYIFGSFNAWNREDMKLEYKDSSYSASVVAFPGLYQYKLIAGNTEFLDPSNTDSIDNGIGGYNNQIQIGQEPDYSLRISPKKIENHKVFISSTKAVDRAMVYWQNNLLPNSFIEKTEDGFWVNIPEINSEGRTFLRVWATGDYIASNDLLIPLQNGKPLVNTNELTRGDWEKSVFYFMMIDRFNNGNLSNDEKVNDPEIKPAANYFGGDIAGIIQKIKDGYFKDLGINTIWISPVSQNPTDAWGLWDDGGVRSKFSGYHGYWPISNVKPDYRFSTPKELQEMLDLAHENNMNVVLDYVANHVHINHPIYQKNKDWATELYLPDGTLNTELWDEQRLTTWFDTHLPTLDLSRPEVVEPLTDSALVWVTEYDFDGFRHDATKHIDELYWRVLMHKLKERVMIPQDRRIYQIGETYGSPGLIKSYISSGMLDAQFDFNLYDAAVGTFALETDYENLVDVLQASLDNYGYHHLMGNISGNQDRSRFITLADGNLDFGEDQKLAGWTREYGKPENHSSYKKLALLHAFNFSIPGIPVIYYGDEYGMPGANDPDNRRQMLFEGLDEDELALKETVAKLTHLRENNLALIYGTTDVEISENGLLLITRKYLDQTIWIVLNNTANEISIEWTENNRLEFGTATLNNNTLTIPPFSFEYIFKN